MKQILLHIVVQESPVGSKPLQSLPAFKALVANIQDRCGEAPVALAVNEVGNYRLF